jgi:hypothetical protein
MMMMKKKKETDRQTGSYSGWVQVIKAFAFLLHAANHIRANLLAFQHSNECGDEGCKHQFLDILLTLASCPSVCPSVRLQNLPYRM